MVKNNNNNNNNNTYIHTYKLTKLIYRLEESPAVEKMMSGNTDIEFLKTNILIVKLIKFSVKIQVVFIK